MLPLRYGCNPHQDIANVYSKSGTLPFRVLNGEPSYINFLDALNSWQLVKELKQALNLPAATSFKHVSPAGVGVSQPLTDALKQAYFVDDLELSPLSTAYARARGTDRMSSYGDWVALSDVVDVPTARLLQREVSDGIIAPGYEAEALTILMRKKQGNYRIFEIDPDYEPSEIETREVFGITLEQRRNDCQITSDILQNVVTQQKDIPISAQQDLLLAYITLKYTQSNSVCLAWNGQTIGVGAGQQSRIHCTQLAAEKARIWYLRQHPQMHNLQFQKRVGRPAKDTAIVQLLQNDSILTIADNELLLETPSRLSEHEQREWLLNLEGVSLGSDGYIPFRDNIDVAYQGGVRYIIQPGGSLRDEAVIEACNDFGVIMCCTGLRLFHH